MDLPSKLRFTRKIAFGWPNGHPLPQDVLGWALSQFNSVPTIDILEPDGSRRKDLPESVRLVWGMEDTMAAYDAIESAEDNVNKLAKNLSKEEFQRAQQEMLHIPFKRIEHWKECQARGTTALYGSGPVFERFWHFWTNHFMVAPGNANNDPLIGPYQRMLREHMVGDFRTLLWHAITHPGIITYLDNHRNTGPNSKAKLRGWTKDSVNENLGRELLELFTLSPSSGYSQRDVEETTLILTGWKYARNGQNKKEYRKPGTYFDYNHHEPGERHVMGKTYSSLFRPTSKLEDLITDLAYHPATAQHIAHKLCVYFLQDSPPVECVEAVKQVFIQSRGHLPSVHQEVVVQAWKTLTNTRKFSSPEAWVLQAHRDLNIDLPRTLPLPSEKGLKYTYLLGDLGQPIPWCPQPNGWPIQSAEWVSKEMIDRRIRYAILMQTFSGFPAKSKQQEKQQETQAFQVLHADFLWS